MNDSQKVLRFIVEQIRAEYAERRCVVRERRRASTRLTEAQRELLCRVKAVEPLAYRPGEKSERDQLVRLRNCELVLSVRCRRQLVWRLTRKGQALLDANE